MSDREYYPSVEEHLARFVAQGGCVTREEWEFLAHVRRAFDAPLGQQIGFGFMMQIVEWEWNHRAQRNEAHTSSLREQCETLKKERDTERKAWARFLKAERATQDATMARVITRGDDAALDKWLADANAGHEAAKQALRDLGVDVDSLLEDT